MKPIQSAHLFGLALILALGCGRADDSALLQSSADALLCGSSSCDGRAPSETRSSAAGPSGASSTISDAGSCYSDAECDDGWECEHEHGQSYCKPRGGDEDRYRVADAGTDAALDCEDDDDCAYGER